jgi:hypothetical protein
MAIARFYAFKNYKKINLSFSKKVPISYIPTKTLYFIDPSRLYENKLVIVNNTVPDKLKDLVEEIPEKSVYLRVSGAVIGSIAIGLGIFPFYIPSIFRTFLEWLEKGGYYEEPTLISFMSRYRLLHQEYENIHNVFRKMFVDFLNSNITTSTILSFLGAAENSADIKELFNLYGTSIMRNRMLNIWILNKIMGIYGCNISNNEIINEVSVLQAQGLGKYQLTIENFGGLTTYKWKEYSIVVTREDSDFVYFRINRNESMLGNFIQPKHTKYKLYFSIPQKIG